MQIRLHQPHAMPGRQPAGLVHILGEIVLAAEMRVPLGAGEERLRLQVPAAQLIRLGDGKLQRFLRLGGEASRKQITDYMPEVRDRILKVLSAQQLPLIQTSEGRQALANDLKTTLARPFAAQLPGPMVADVLFTAFVVQ